MTRLDEFSLLFDLLLMHRMGRAGYLHLELAVVAFVGRESAAAVVDQPLASFLVEPSFVDASEVAEAFRAAGEDARNRITLRSVS